MITIKRIIQTEGVDNGPLKEYILYVLMQGNQRIDSFLKYRNAIDKCRRLGKKWRYER